MSGNASELKAWTHFLETTTAPVLTIVVRAPPMATIFLFDITHVRMREAWGLR